MEYIILSPAIPENVVQKMDDATLPLVRDAIRRLQGDEDARPIRITIPSIERILNLPDRQITHNLPKCKAEIEQHKESQEQYSARKVVWAANQVINAGGTLSWVKISRLIHMRRRYFEACLPYICDYANEELAQKIKNLSHSQ